MTAMTAITAGLAAAWAALVAAAALRRRPPPPRLRRALASAPARRRTAPRPAVATAAAVVAALLAATVALPLGALVPALWWGRSWWRGRVAARRQRAAIAADLPEVVDLLRVAVGSGLTIPLAIDAVGRRADGPVARALAQAQAAAQRGGRLADELDGLPAVLGEASRPLAATLAGSLRYGHAIGPALERLAAECREDQRRAAETAARRVPVLLLFPLVACILPAFALLTVAPLLAGALRALRL
jgi:tight adherence protein C